MNLGIFDKAKKQLSVQKVGNLSSESLVNQLKNFQPRLGVSNLGQFSQSIGNIRRNPAQHKQLNVGQRDFDKSNQVKTTPGGVGGNRVVHRRLVATQSGMIIRNPDNPPRPSEPTFNKKKKKKSPGGGIIGGIIGQIVSPITTGEEEIGRTTRSGIEAAKAVAVEGEKQAGETIRTGITETALTGRVIAKESGKSVRTASRQLGLTTRVGLKEAGLTGRRALSETGMTLRSGIEASRDVLVTGEEELASVARDAIEWNGIVWTVGLVGLFSAMVMLWDSKSTRTVAEEVGKSQRNAVDEIAKTIQENPEIVSDVGGIVEDLVPTAQASKIVEKL